MSSRTYKNENTQIKGIISQFKDAYRTSCEASRNAYMKTLPSGAPIPKEGVIYGDDYKEEFRSMCCGYRARADEIIDGVIARLKKVMTEAPSSEAVNVVSLLKMRNNLSIEEVRDLLDRYGDNPQTWKAISSIANDHELYVGNHPIYEEMKDVEGLKRSIDKTLTPLNSNYTNTNTRDGFLSILNMQIDGALPTE